MSQNTKPPRCPSCGSKSQHAKGGMYECLNKATCGGLFINAPNTDTTAYSDPSKRLRLQEAEEERIRREKQGRIPRQFR